MKDELKRIEEAALAEITSAQDGDTLEKIRVKYIGRKGVLTEIFKRISEVPVSDRPEIGKLINVVKSSVANALDGKIATISTKKEEKAEKLDITLPGVSTTFGRIHPITKTVQEICDIFV
ncbi:MAG: phenylalanine--tRNA ligase subunit alpha, partial [Candidatus Omnitrophica bacterium]|nr:phenylalanine--tRNA ligase subunit alpha [Candidatus Omnitrophota bacterium]